MKFWIALITTALMSSGCSVFRNTAVDQHVAVSRDLTLQGLAANSSHDDTHAEQYFSQAVNSDPDNVEARMLLAESFRKRGEIDAAIKQLEQALKISPENTELICQLGACYSVSKQEKYAYRLAQLALRKNKESVEAWSLKAQTLWKMGMREPALADYQRALRIDPDNLELRFQMAKLYLELGKPQRALTTLDKLSEEYHEVKVPEELLLLQANALAQLKRFDESADRLQIGFERGNYSESLAMSYVDALLRSHDTSKANQALRIASTRFPSSANLSQLRQNLDHQIRLAAEQATPIR